MLSSERARVTLLSKELASLRERRSEDDQDVNVKSLYDKIDQMAEREKKLVQEIMRLTTQRESKDVSKALNGVGMEADDACGAPVTAHLVDRTAQQETAETKELKARIESLEDASRKSKQNFDDNGVLGKRLSYLENALEASEKQRRRLEALLKKAKKSGSGKLQATVIASPKGKRDVDELIAFNHELQSKYDALNDDYLALRNKFKASMNQEGKQKNGKKQVAQKSKKKDAKLSSEKVKADVEAMRAEKEELEATLDSLKSECRVLRRKFDNAITENKSILEKLESKDNESTELSKRLQIAEQAMKIEKSRIAKQKHDMEIAVQNKLQALEKRQVEVEAELNHDRTSLTQTAVKVEADLRTELATTKTKKQQLEAECLELKSQLMTQPKNKYRIVTTNTRSRNPIYERAE